MESKTTDSKKPRRPSCFFGAYRLTFCSIHPTSLIIVEFPDIEQARVCYRSPEYALVLEVRDKALTRIT
ncbi:MAG: DUF1330 domain-containing protein [Desulfobulbaceae bacterium]|nr:DUF1330 domain-containing protein [Desulfobulbaceae bacterium]